MHLAEAKSHIGRHVKVSPHKYFQKWGVGILRSLDRDIATVMIRGRNGEASFPIRVNIQNVKRWAKADELDQLRRAAVVGATAGAEIIARDMVESAGLPEVSDRTVYPSDKILQITPKNDMNAKPVPVYTDSEGKVIITGKKLSEVNGNGFNVCHDHGNDEPCHQCEAKRKAEAAAAKILEENKKMYGEQFILMDTKSGRVWGGGDKGFLDGVSDTDNAIKSASRMSQQDARRLVTTFKNGFSNRVGQYFRDGMDCMTAEAALSVLTDPAREFHDLPPETLGVANASFGSVRKGWRKQRDIAAKLAIKEFTPNEKPADAPPAPADDLPSLLVRLANSVKSAGAEIEKAEADSAERKREVDLAREVLKNAETALNAAKSRVAAARQKMGGLKSQMMTLIERQGA